MSSAHLIVTVGVAVGEVDILFVLHGCCLRAKKARGDSERDRETERVAARATEAKHALQLRLAGGVGEWCESVGSWLPPAKREKNTRRLRERQTDRARRGESDRSTTRTAAAAGRWRAGRVV